MRTLDTFDVRIDDFAAGESIIYGIVWGPWLKAASIASSTLELDPNSPQDLTLDNAGVQDKVQTQLFRVSGGSAGEVYKALATVLDNLGNTYKVSLLVEVGEA